MKIKEIKYENGKYVLVYMLSESADVYVTYDSAEIEKTVNLMKQSIITKVESMKIDREDIKASIFEAIKRYVDEWNHANNRKIEEMEQRIKKELYEMETRINMQQHRKQEQRIEKKSLFRRIFG